MPPGVSEYRLLGDGGGSREDDDASAGSMGDNLDELGAGREEPPSSASARAFPVSRRLIMRGH